MEISLLAGGIVLYFVRNVVPAMRKKAVIAFGIALVVVQGGDTYVPRTPLSPAASAMGVWVFYTLFVLTSFAVERISGPRKINAP